MPVYAASEAPIRPGGSALHSGGRGEQSGDTIAAEPDDIACQGGEIGEQGVKAVQRERCTLRGLGAFASGLAQLEQSRPGARAWSIDLIAHFGVERVIPTKM